MILHYMRFHWIAVNTFLLGCLVAGFTQCQTEPKTETATVDSTSSSSKPNVIVIVADDLGWNDISANGNKEIPTPNIDGIGKDGVHFTQGYSTAPICGPSRAGLITGRYQQRFGQEFQIHGNVKDPSASKTEPEGYIEAFLPQNFDRNKQGLPTTEVTLGELLKKNGYATSLIGKWHLGYEPEYLPENRGYDSHFGFLGGATSFADTNDKSVVTTKLPWVNHYNSGLNRNDDRAIRSEGKVIEVKEYLTYRFRDEAIKFIEINKDKPFFLQLTFNAIHTPIQAPKEIFDRFAHIKDPAKRNYYALTAALDESVGKINDKLKELNLDKNTIVFFISDNGGASYTRLTDNAPLKGGKLTHYEGGVRVPFFVKWPAKVAAGQVYDKPVIHLDIFTTVAKAAGATLPEGKKYDGVDLVEYVDSSNAGKTPHEALFWRSGYAKAVRKGDFKLIVNSEKKTKQLYNIAVDPSEKQNLAKEKADVVKDLETTLASWESELKEPLWKSWRIGRVKIDKNETYYSPL